MNRFLRKILFGNFKSIMLVITLTTGGFYQTHAMAGEPSEQMKPNPTLKKRKLQIGGKTVTVEIADTEDTRMRGLMFRKSLANDTGMLFVFEQEQQLSFWMKNTLIPLSIGYFNAEKRLLEVHEMVPAVIGDEQPPAYPCRLPAKYALEMPRTWFARNGILPKATFKFLD